MGITGPAATAVEVATYRKLAKLGFGHAEIAVIIGADPDLLTRVITKALEQNPDLHRR